MTIDHLSYVLEIERYQSISKAAKYLFISQPTLSNILKNLESEVGYKIFQRTNIGITPTEQGEVFLRSAERMTNEYSRLKSARSIESEHNNLLISASSSSVFSYSFFNYKKDNPTAYDTQDVYRESVLDQTYYDIISNVCRLGLIYISQNDFDRTKSYMEKNDLEHFIIKENLPIRVAVSKNNELASQGYVDFNDLYKYRFVTYDGLDFQKNLGHAGIKEEMDVQYISSRSTFYDAIRVTDYIAFTMDFAPGEAHRHGCVCLPVKNLNDAYKAAYFTIKGQTLTQRETSYISYVHKVLNEVYS
ncbi:MAG: LysR family transcriptional regulator [Clostridiales bacterium]|jgi:DNA-binding transcriptional LysR family regulator|nr:LysR family transcriptional regulator [Clostridiales bacterium]